MALTDVIKVAGFNCTTGEEFVEYFTDDELAAWQAEKAKLAGTAIKPKSETEKLVAALVKEGVITQEKVDAEMTSVKATDVTTKGRTP